MECGVDPVKKFEEWYVQRKVDARSGCLEYRGLAPHASALKRRYEDFKREMDARTSNFHMFEKVADNQVLKPVKDLPNISSGETSGLVRRLARTLVQNTPQVDVVSKFDDDSVEGIFARHILLSKIIGSDLYSNDMQQSLFASTKSALTLGFDCVIPVLQRDALGSWSILYDTIHYHDVFPEPGSKDVRSAAEVFVRRYLTQGDVKQLIDDETPGWDVPALKALAKTKPRTRSQESIDQQSKKKGVAPEGYEILTWYNSYGDPFLTVAANSFDLLRIEENRHPLQRHPVFFLVLEKDAQQPLGKSQVEMVMGRQEFQDLMLNGSMKMWYRNINPPLIGYGTVNALPNLSPGKFTEISNPNARIEAFEVNTQTLLQYGSISNQNLSSMVQIVGAPDNQLATLGAGGNAMSGTSAGVDAQTEVVDITTNNYQKAIEQFFSHYCSYALTLYFQELKGAIKTISPSADARLAMIKAGLPKDSFDEKGQLKLQFSDLAVEYAVRCVPGTLVELEDEKQQRLLNDMFIPLSQAMPALAASGDQQLLVRASQTMQYILQKQMELSGSIHATDLKKIFSEEGGMDAVSESDARIEALEGSLSDITTQLEERNNARLDGMQDQISMIAENMSLLIEKLGVNSNQSMPDNSQSQPVEMYD